ncbi:hypothetical protein ACQ4PT_045006 [Festuca glaucescens]
MQGDEDLDAEQSVESEEDGYEVGAWGDEGEEDEGGWGEEGEEGEDVPGKALWVHGSATLPDAPKTEEGKLVVYVEKQEALGLVGTRGHRPSGILTILLKKYWPGLYRTIPDGPQKLALKWEDYHAAPCGVMTTTTEDGRRVVPTCAQVVLRTFWEHYKVSVGTDQQEATAVLELMAKKNLRDTFYHIRQLAISHYYAEQGKRRNKDRVIAENLTIEDDTGWERARVAEAYEQLQEEFQQKMHGYEVACSASRQHDREQTKALFEALRTGAPPPLYVEPPVVPPLPKMPTKTEFLAQVYGRTPVSALPYY